MLLSDAQIEAVTSALDGWKRNGRQLNKTFEFRTFAAALTWVNRVAQLAEETDHHPDIDIRYNEVTLHLSTHSHGGITEKDAFLAELIDDLPGEHDE